MDMNDSAEQHATNTILYCDEPCLIKKNKNSVELIKLFNELLRASCTIKRDAA